MFSLAIMLTALILGQEPAQNPAAPIQVAIKTVEAQPVVQIRFKAKPDEIAQKLGKSYGRITGHIVKHKGEQVMMPLSRYYDISTEVFDMAACIPVKEPIPSEGEIQCVALPAGKVASVSHFGPYQKLQETYAKLYAWLEENGHERGDQAWEIYWTDPTTAKDSSELRTEIVLLLKEQR